MFKLHKLTTMNPIEENKKNSNFFYANKQKIGKLIKKTKNLNSKNLVNKIYKLIVKELKFNTNHHIKTCRSHNLLRV